MIGLIGDLSGAGFAALRTDHFRRLLPDARCVDWRDPDLDLALRSAAALVTAGIFGPTRAALLAVRDRPLWLDLPGDPFADAQAAAHAPAPGAHPGAPLEAAALFPAAIRRADAFSTIGERARLSLLGQLGITGRLAALPPGTDPVHVLPVAWLFPQPPRPPRPCPPAPSAATPLHVALFGSFNTWYDDQTLLAGLLLALDTRPGAIRVCCIGGSVPGHYTAGYDRFRTGALASPHAAAFRFLPGLPPAALPAALAPCPLTVCLDRPGFEPLFGSRTRLLFALHQGITPLTTTRTALAAELCALGAAHPLPPGDPHALARALLRPPAPPDPAIVQTVAARFDPDRTGAPLAAWAADPRRTAPDPESADPVIGLLREREALRQELQDIRASRSWRLLAALRRVLS